MTAKTKTALPLYDSLFEAIRRYLLNARPFLIVSILAGIPTLTHDLFLNIGLLGPGPVELILRIIILLLGPFSWLMLLFLAQDLVSGRPLDDLRKPLNSTVRRFVSFLGMVLLLFFALVTAYGLSSVLLSVANARGTLALGLLALFVFCGQVVFFVYVIGTFAFAPYVFVATRCRSLEALRGGMILMRRRFWQVILAHLLIIVAFAAMLFPILIGAALLGVGRGVILLLANIMFMFMFPLAVIYYSLLFKVLKIQMTSGSISVYEKSG